MRRNTIVPQRNRTVIPLDTYLYVLTLGDVLPTFQYILILGKEAGQDKP